MADLSPLGSNNPFRRKPAADPAAAPPPQPAAAPAADPAFSSLFDSASPLPTGDEFRSQLRTLPQSAQPPPKTSFQKPKVVKKVRVQSPPPSSPESAGVPDFFPPARQYNDYDDDSSSDEHDERDNPFGMGETSIDGPEVPPEPPMQPISAPGPPPNPFQRTLSDMERSGTEVAQQGGASTGGKGALDVNAFRRLLMTGQAGASAQAPPPNPSPPVAQSSGQLLAPGDGGSPTDASSISRQSLSDAAHAQETPRTSHEISEPEGEDDRHGLIGPPATKKAGPPTTLRKKPPPPSSRHGKLIKVELKEAEQKKDADEASRPLSSHSATSSLPSPTGQQTVSASDVNKPLPPAPERPDEAESVFDREAAGKVPERDDLESEVVDLPPARPPTPPNASHATSSPPAPPQASKKPVPPPRRQPHGRSESKQVPAPAPVPPVDENEPAPARSSFESNRSRSSSLRVNIHGPGPAPPPPRRPAHGSRTQGSFASPSAVSFGSVASSDGGRSPSDPERSPSTSQFSSMTETIHPANTLSPAASSSSLSQAPGQGKLIPPPPPPARNASVRSNRPASVSSFDGVSRRVSREKEGGAIAPPPPPPRQRGSSKSSIDAPSLGPRRTSIESVKFRGGSRAEESEIAIVKEEDEGTTLPADPEPIPESEATNILADLDALRREVDALRGQYGQAGGGP
ncbi:hypothetical protein GQ53DRAFT_749049 [Thozetella sp. PMI_491]|nr:hypothetical protein GQ53DRAFT_749049 [Thozetella sp. PMI_491]